MIFKALITINNHHKVTNIHTAQHIAAFSSAVSVQLAVEAECSFVVEWGSKLTTAAAPPLLDSWAQTVSSCHGILLVGLGGCTAS